MGLGQQRDRSLGVYLMRSALLSYDDRNLPGGRPPTRRSVKRHGACILAKLQKVVLAPISVAETVGRESPSLFEGLLLNGHYSAPGGQESPESS